jgi:repressor LexA
MKGICMARSAEMTVRQKEVLDFIRTKIENRGFPPSIREICDAFDFKSPNAVTGHLKALERKGFINRMEHKSARAIEVPDIRVGRVSFPLLGLVSAGMGIEAVQQDDQIDLGELFGGKEHFALRVRGTSMIEDHIADGDIVIIKKQPTANNGERVVAMIDREVTLKKFYKKRDSIRLEPANSTMEAIVVTPDRDISILGVLVGVVRKC